VKLTVHMVLMAVAGFFLPLQEATKGDVLQQVIPAVVRGSVSDALSNQPVAGASVILSPDGGRTRMLVVDSSDTGAFAFTGVPPGKYVVWATRAGYSGGYLGQRAPVLDAPPVFVEIAAGTDRGGLNLRLWKNAVISGKFEDASGRPIVGATVQAYRRGFLAGHSQMLRAGGATARTDDRGVYRLHQLIPGSYAIVAKPTPESPPVYYPQSSSLLMATVLSVSAGDELSDIDIRVDGRVTARRRPNVSGRILPAGGGAPPANVQLLPLNPADPAAIAPDVDVRTAAVLENGQFVFQAVHAGSYRIRSLQIPAAIAPPGTVSVVQSSNGRATVGPRELGAIPLAPTPTAETYLAEATVDVGEEDVRDIILAPSPAGRIWGRIQFDGAATPPAGDALLSIPIGFLTANGAPLGTAPVARVERSGQFTTVGLPPGRYVVLPLSLPSPWRVAAVRQNGADLDSEVVTVGAKGASGVVIVLTDRPFAEVSGMVSDSRGRPSSTAVVYVFPSDRDLWTDFGPQPSRLRQSRPDARGRYSLRLPAGSYLLAAMDSDVPTVWMGAEVLEMLAKSATAVRVQDGVDVVKDLKAR
jgi:hypothetical protein